LIYFFSLALGPHPQRELSLTPRRSRGAVWPRALLSDIRHRIGRALHAFNLFLPSGI
jgi:hypothetical protein